MRIILCLLAVLCSAFADDHRSKSSGTSGVWANGGRFRGNLDGYEDQNSFNKFAQRLKARHALIPNKVEARVRKARNAIKDPDSLWAGGQVPYVIESEEAQLRAAVTVAIQDIQNSTCIRFIQRTNETDYLKIVEGDECSSEVGNQRNGGQLVQLQRGCWTKKAALHELIHAIGFWHEHQRIDRDQYIEVIERNIESSEYQVNYGIPGRDETRLIGSYDVDSIMHYRPDLFAKAGRRAMILRASDRLKFGNSESMTTEDIRKIRILYSCDNDTDGVNTTCPETVRTHFVTNGGDRIEMCAQVYDQSHCRGNSLRVGSTWNAGDLSTKIVTGMANWNWNKKIASHKINPWCSITLCSDRNFLGVCDTYSGEAGGKNIDPVKNYRNASSMKCVCNECPTSVTATYTDDNGVTQPLCAQVYDQPKCGGNNLTFAIWSSLNLFDVRRYGGENWSNKVRSAAVNPECKLKLCSEKNFATCSTYEGGKTGQNFLTVRGRVESLWCTCGAGMDEPNIWHGLQRGQTLPAHIPRDAINAPGQITCAVAIQTFTDYGLSLWLTDGDMTEDRGHMPWAYTYIGTHPGCTLYYCEGAQFTSTCSTLGPGSYSPSLGYDGFFKLRSLICTCNDYTLHSNTNL